MPAACPELYVATCLFQQLLTIFLFRGQFCVSLFIEDALRGEKNSMSGIVIQLAEYCNVESSELYIRRREFYRRICGIFKRVQSLCQ